MTTMRDLLARAIRRTRQRPLGEDPAAEEADAALDDAQALFLTLTNRQLTDVLISANYEAGEDERVNMGGGSYTVTLPTSITNGCGTRAPRAGAIVEVAGATLERNIYVPELGSWSGIGGLTLDDEQPFGPSLDDALADVIAAHICSTVFQVDPSATLITLDQQGRSAFEARFSPPINVVTDPGLLRPILGGYFIS